MLRLDSTAAVCISKCFLRILKRVIVLNGIVWLFRDASLFSAVKDYLAIEKGWFSPYLFASGRRPIIPRSIKPDVVFCHGPFLQGDSMLYFDQRNGAFAEQMRR